MTDFTVKDSGEREEFATGSRRDTQVGKGRYDLIPYEPLRQLAVLYEQGAEKYGDRNWEKGQPLSRYANSGTRHLQHVLNADVDENHPIQAAWNMLAIAYTVDKIRKGELPRELDDIGYIDALEDAEEEVNFEPFDTTDFEPFQRALNESLQPLDDDDDAVSGWTDLGYVTSGFVDEVEPLQTSTSSWFQSFVRRASEAAARRRMQEAEQRVVDSVKIRPVDRFTFDRAIDQVEDPVAYDRFGHQVVGQDILDAPGEPVEAELAEEVDQECDGLDLTPEWEDVGVFFGHAPRLKPLRNPAFWAQVVQESIDRRG